MSESSRPRPKLAGEALIGFTEKRDVALVRLEPHNHIALRRDERLRIRAKEPADGSGSGLMRYAILVRGETGYAVVDLAPGRWKLVAIDDE